MSRKRSINHEIDMDRLFVPLLPPPILMVRPNPPKWNLEIRSMGGK